jgi:hypothetical protein
MKRIDINEILIGIIESGKEFEELTEVEQKVLALRGDLDKFKKTEECTERAFMGAFIGKLAGDLKTQGVII